MNLGVADSFFAVLDRKNGLVHFHIALDYEPIPNYVAIYDYRRDRWLTDPCVWGTAGGFLEDGAGLIHRCRIDDFGLLWREDAGNSDGVYAGSTTATLTGTPTVLAWPASAAAFNTTTANGSLGSLVERYSTAGEVVDQNRVAAVSSTQITPLYWSSSAPSSGQTLGVGAIPGVAEGGGNGFDTSRVKHVTAVYLGHEVESSSTVTLNFMSAMDEDELARPPNLTTIDLSANEGSTPVAVSDRGWTWRWQMSQRYAGQDFSIESMEILFHVTGTSR
jgi:hypothetical protein